MNLFLVKINFSLKFDNISVLYAHKKHSLYKKRLSLIDLQLPFFHIMLAVCFIFQQLRFAEDQTLLEK